MTKDEILRMAQNETHIQKMDEREKKDFDRSFYWAFIATAFAMLVFSIVRLTRDENVADMTAIVTFAAFAASLYRFVKFHRYSMLFIAIMNLLMTINSTYDFLFK